MERHYNLKGSTTPERTNSRLSSKSFLIFLTLVIASFGNVWGQTCAQYTFTTGSGASLDPMSGATSLIGPNNDDLASAVVDIGFPFIFLGSTYTQFSVSSNGLMRLGNTGVTLSLIHI
jgi:hypothetical protein